MVLATLFNGSEQRHFRSVITNVTPTVAAAGQKDGVNNIEEGVIEQDAEQSDDPFNIYPMLNKLEKMDRKENISDGSLKYSPGYSPKENHDKNSFNGGGDSKGIENSIKKNVTSKNCKFTKQTNDGGNDLISSGHFKVSEIPRNGGSILGLLDEVVKVGQVMGYKMKGCVSNIAEIIKAQGAEECVRACWGNLAFDYVHSAAVGNSGEILCVWDSNSFDKESDTLSDSFVLIREIWRLTGQKLLLVAVYAPQDAREKNMLWEFGSVFNEQGALSFNSFIENSGLMEINLGGCHFTWCHKSANKMSKLDRFLVSKSLLNTCPNIAATTLDRYLSDHQPIILREVYVDYGPISLNFFHYWFDIEGFNKVVEDAWNDYVGEEANKRSGNGGEDEVYKRTEIINKMQKIDEIQSKGLAQKVKIKWAIEGNENSSFFHGMLNKKRTSMSVRGVMVDGVWVDDPHKVKKEFLDHFSARFCKPNKKGVSILMDFPNKISAAQLRDLECEVSDEEIKRAVWDCGTEKAPGPDGFTFGFFRRFDTLFMVTWLLLPISLIGSFYKIIAKNLANRLVGVLDDIVNEVQTAFIKDSQILDGPFILNEVLQWCKTKKKQALMFKVDFKKAYDSVRWDFLDEVLRKFGFGDKWCRWIQCCLKSSRGSIIMNGSPTEEFQFGKGLKQGDPLSPFLFILLMESLHLSFQRIVDAGMFHDIKLSRGLVNLSHMFFADDAVFVGQWCENNITTLVHVLECFHKASGLCINMSKSKIMRVHVDNIKVNIAATKLGCLVFKTPFMYLGSIVGGNMSRINTWNVIVDKVKKSIEAVRSRFLNGHVINNKKATWVNWKKALASRERGGLGISSLYAMNIGLLLKWVCRFFTQKKTLWGRVIQALHGENGKIGTVSRSGHNSCWLVIVQELSSLLKNRIDVMKYLWIKLGNGEDTKFWEDKWCDGGTLKDRFHRLYALESCKHITVGRKLSQHNLSSSFRRNPRGGIEMDQFGVETTSHLFFACLMVRKVVNLINRWWSLADVELESYEDWVIWFDHIRLPSQNKKMSEGVFYVMWWLLWSFRNKTIFESKVPKKALFFDDVVSSGLHGQRCSDSYRCLFPTPSPTIACQRCSDSGVLGVGFVVVTMIGGGDDDWWWWSKTFTMRDMLNELKNGNGNEGSEAAADTATPRSNARPPNPSL
nr:RNA-directed DNA polymerase, eukaryota, reverse transcriptase zinc-binding domain protein [Tanacetum cinerariifolium]